MKNLFAPVIVGLVLSIGVAHAGEVSEAAKLKEEVNKLNERVKALEKKDRLFDGGESWVDRITISGDFRYRHETIIVDPSDGREKTRHLHPIRVRLGLKANVNSEVSVGLRVTSGNTDAANATMQTLGDNFSGKNIWLDRAYVTYKPAALGNFGVEISAGKVPNPFYRPGGSQLIWDTDVNPEGVAAKAKLKIEPVEIFLAGGGFWVGEDADHADNGLFGLQTGFKLPIADTGVTVLAGMSGFWYTPSENEGPFAAAKGNSIDAALGGYENEFNLLEVFGEVQFKLGEIPVKIAGDYVNNTDIDEEDTGWLVGVIVGTRKEQWDWNFKYCYRELEKDAVVGAFCDSVFGGGGTNAKGHTFGFGLQLAKDVNVCVTYFLNEQNIASGEEEDDYHRLQIDFNFKF